MHPGDPVSVDPAGFDEFFEAIYGYFPFAWQSRLASQVVTEAWPEGIDVPTGLGKTALLDMAVYALAVQASFAPEERTAPTRTFAVVDRRVVVDQTFARAGKLARGLLEAPSGIVADVAHALRSLSGGGPPLEVVRMRGGVTWSWRWLASPDQPAIVVGTVDQYGSRLLFRGYGVGAQLRAIDAALCGSDALLILDEAHIARPLADTAQQVHRYESAAAQPVLAHRRPHPVLISATLPGGLRDVFRPDMNEESSQEAQARLGTPKLTRLLQLGTKAKDPVADLARALAALATEALAGEDTQRVGVVCNTIRVAREVFQILDASLGDVDRCLLIGRSRGWDRERNASAWESHLGRDRDDGEAKILAVATQTIEVGADFDFDALVTEAAPLDALIQRLGRLNRFGRPAGGSATVLYCDRRHDPDAVYGTATARTWAWLTQLTGPPAPAPASQISTARRSAPTLDLSSLQLQRLVTPEVRARLAADPALAPTVLGPTLDAWSHTEPAPAPDQPVAPFLHGIERGVPEVLVCWRAGLPSGGEEVRGTWEQELDITPIADGECVSVPLWEAERFLAAGQPGEVADLEGTPQPAEVEPARDHPEQADTPAAWIRLLDGTLLPAPHNRLTPGAFLIVRSESGGHDQWGWTGRLGPPVPDVADIFRHRYRIRLRAGLLHHLLVPGNWGGALQKALAKDETDLSVAALRSIAAASLPDDSAVWQAVGTFVTKRAGVLADLLIANQARIVRVQRGSRRDGDQVDLLIAQARVDDAEAVGFESEGDDDVDASSNTGTVVGLEQHLRDVARQSAAVAGRLGLTPKLIASLELAGRAHDLGKADKRFQVMLHGGQRLRAEAWPEPVAKSGTPAGDQEARIQALRRSGWPIGMRHEAVSLALLQNLHRMRPEVFAGTDPELVDHLVSTHHGWGRPLFPAVRDPRPVPVAARLPGESIELTASSDDTLIDWSAPDRFERLTRRYGWWGLALLESVVRLADMACSEAYAKGGEV